MNSNDIKYIYTNKQQVCTGSLPPSPLPPPPPPLNDAKTPAYTKYNRASNGWIRATVSLLRSVCSLHHRQDSVMPLNKQTNKQKPSSLFGEETQLLRPSCLRHLLTVRLCRSGERSKLIIPAQSLLTSLNFLLRELYKSRLLVTTKGEEPNSPSPPPPPHPREHLRFKANCGLLSVLPFAAW